jgi:hypothetical protein
MKTPQEKGKAFEEEFRLYLKEVMQKHPMASARFYDTHSAGAFLPDQPGDTIACFRGICHLFELKSSEVHASLSAGLSKLLANHQATHLKIWARAGASTHVLFWQQSTGVIELWDGECVAVVRHAPHMRLKPEGVCETYPDFEAFKAAFTAALLHNPRYTAKKVFR